MKYRQLGISEMTVSEISLGTWGVGEGLDEGNLRTCLFTALDLGINLIDTSNSYASGAAESFLGKTLKGIDRSSYYLATKVFFQFHQEMAAFLQNKSRAILICPCSDSMLTMMIYTNVIAMMKTLLCWRR